MLMVTVIRLKNKEQCDIYIYIQTQYKKLWSVYDIQMQEKKNLSSGILPVCTQLKILIFTSEI